MTFPNPGGTEFTNTLTEVRYEKVDGIWKSKGIADVNEYIAKTRSSLPDEDDYEGGFDGFKYLNRMRKKLNCDINMTAVGGGFSFELRTVKPTGTDTQAAFKVGIYGSSTYARMYNENRVVPFSAHFPRVSYDWRTGVMTTSYDNNGKDGYGNSLLTREDVDNITAELKKWKDYIKETSGYPSLDGYDFEDIMDRWSDSWKNLNNREDLLKSSLTRLVIENIENGKWFGRDETNNSVTGTNLTWKEFIADLSTRVDALLREKGVTWSDDIPVGSKFYNFRTEKQYVKQSDGTLKTYEDIEVGGFLEKGKDQQLTPGFRTSGSLSFNGTGVFKDGDVKLVASVPSTKETNVATKKYVDDKFNGIVQEVKDAFDVIKGKSRVNDLATFTGWFKSMEEDQYFGRALWEKAEHWSHVTSIMDDVYKTSREMSVEGRKHAESLLASRDRITALENA